MRELQAKDVGTGPVERVVGNALPVRVLLMNRAVLGAQRDIVSQEIKDWTEDYRQEEVALILMVRVEYTFPLAIEIAKVHIKKAKHVHYHVIKEHAK